MTKAYIGTSGYMYDHWSGVFYPEDLAKNKWLEHYCRFFNTVELNVTFYHLPLESVFRNWYKRTPDDFLFIIKGSRFITHIKRLNDCAEPLKLLMERASQLKEKLGMILWQTPPQFDFQAELRNSKLKTQNAKPQLKTEKFTRFCELLGKFSPTNLRQAFEFRHKNWFCQEVYAILKKYNFALVICDYPFELTTNSKQLTTNNRQIIQVPETADFIYLRRHGATALYASNYSDAQLKRDAGQIKKWLKSGKSGKDIYVYFNNDAQGYAVKNALKLKEMIK